jgi:hypothetical protein
MFHAGRETLYGGPWHTEAVVFECTIFFAVCDLVLLSANRKRALSSIAECGRWCNINERYCDEFGNFWNVNIPMSVCSVLSLQRLHDPLILDYSTPVLRKTRRFVFCLLQTSGTIGDSEEESGVSWHKRRRRSSVTAANHKGSVIEPPIIVRGEVVDCAIWVSDSCTVDCEDGPPPSTGPSVTPYLPNFVCCLEGSVLIYICFCLVGCFVA